MQPKKPTKIFLVLLAPHIRDLYLLPVLIVTFLTKKFASFTRLNLDLLPIFEINWLNYMHSNSKGKL